MNRLFKTITFLTVILVFGVSDIVAQNFAAPFLLRSTSVEGDAMGRAYTALATDASATYWNPAGLSGVSTYSVTGLVSADLAFDREFNAFSGAYTVEDIGTFGFSFTQAGVDDIQQFSAANEFVGNFDTNSIAVGASYAREVFEGFSVGTTARFINQDLEVLTDKGFHFDVGTRYQKNMFSFGAVLQNIAGEIGDDDLPLVFRTGFAIQDFKGFTASVDFELEGLDSEDDNTESRANLGLGYDINVIENFTIGPRIGLANEDLAAGAKLGFVTDAIGFDVDYAYVNEPNILGESHRIGVTVFGF